MSTFRWGAEEARRVGRAAAAGHRSRRHRPAWRCVRRIPRGPVLGISPFNFPLNLVAHKVAPAVAVGAPIVLKPAPKTPLSALLLGELLAETDLPAGRCRCCRCPTTRRPTWWPTRGCRWSRSPGGAGRRRDPRGGAAQARDPRARRERGGAWSAPTGRRRGPRLGGRRASRRSRNYQGGQSLHLGAAGVRRLVAVRRLVPRLVAAVERWAPVTRPTRRPRWARSSTRRPPARRAWVEEAVAPARGS